MALPNYKNIPAEFSQLLEILRIPLLVSFELWTPVFNSGFGYVEVNTPAMLMPEATSNLDNLLKCGKHQIRFSRKLWRMEPVAVAHAVDQMAYTYLGRHAFALDMAHVFAAPCRGY